MLLLGVGMIFGLIGAIQYIIPGYLKTYLSFEKVRPLHVSSVIFWILFGATGGVLTYLQEHSGRPLYSVSLAKTQLFIFAITTLIILASYVAGSFGGREYWEFNPVLALPILVGWILFIINVTRTAKSWKGQPVYWWMWLTGAVFFLFTFLESYLWVFPYFRENIINDMTVQWKSYGSMVGAWNMLLYGSSIYLMGKISGNQNYGHSKIAFLLYFTGLFNLMFNWGHHIYTLPTHHFIKNISYAVSMTELFIFGRIIYLWRATLTTAMKHYHHMAYRFLVASEVWVFLSLLLAITMSIPAINVYTHGTHITVAHTMGATIGINSFLILAFAFDILNNSCVNFNGFKSQFNKAFWVSNISLFVFWLSLIAAGILKSSWLMSAERTPFAAMVYSLKPYFEVFLLSGFFLLSGLLWILFLMLKNQLRCYFNQILGRNNSESSI